MYRVYLSRPETSSLLYPICSTEEDSLPVESANAFAFNDLRSPRQQSFIHDCPEEFLVAFGVLVAF